MFCWSVIHISRLVCRSCVLHCDAFHPVFPLCIEEPALTSEPGANGAEDPLFKLPTEVCDLILCRLSPAALDAARHVCRLWRRYIMRNHWVLSTVTSQNAMQPSFGPRLPDQSAAKEEGSLPIAKETGSDLTLRDLLKSLDRSSNTLSTHLEADSWRTRFRRRNIEFIISEADQTSTQSTSNPRFKAVARIGLQYGFILLHINSSYKPSTSTPESKSTLMFFRLDSRDLPLYVGSTEILGPEGTVPYVSIAELKPKHSWTLKIAVDNDSKFYLIEVRNAFAKLDSCFLFTELHHFEVVQQYGVYLAENPFTQFMFATPARSARYDASLRILASFPRNESISSPSIDLQESGRYLSDINSPRLHDPSLSGRIPLHDEPRHLAEDVASGNVIVISKSDDVEDSAPCLVNPSVQEDAKPNIRATEILVRPYTKCVLRNVAIAPVATRHSIVRVAIIWQSKDEPQRRPELYVYDVPEATNYGNYSSYSDYMASSRSSDTVAGFPNCRVVQGKRVTSLDHQLGGIHPLSPVLDLEALRATDLEEQNALGGLQLPHSDENQDNYPLKAQYQKCFVWGPIHKENNVFIQFQIFDFSYEGRQKGSGAMPATRSPFCACALHDDGFRIMLPPSKDVDATLRVAKNEPAKLQFSSVWPWKPKVAPRLEQPVPVSTPVDSVAWKEAIDRETTWIKERIICMKAAGLSNYDITNLWIYMPWAKGGRIGIPDGWKDL